MKMKLLFLNRDLDDFIIYIGGQKLFVIVIGILKLLRI